MMKKSLLLLSLVLFVGFTYAQDPGSKPACLKVTSFSTSLGFGGAMTSNTDADYYYLKNASENPSIFEDIKGFDNNGSSWGFSPMGSGGMYYSGGGGGNGNVLFNLGLTPYSKKQGKYRENRELRFSLGGSFGGRNYFYYNDDNYFVIDTFQSVNGTDLIYADSVINTDYYYSLDFSEINIGFSYLFKTDVSRRVHFYAGAGFNYGITLRSTVNVDKNIYRSVYYYNENDKPSGDESLYYGTYNSNDFSYYSSASNLKNPMQFVRVFIPLGFSLNLSKKKDSFFSHVDLYTELNPGVEFQMLSSEKTYANPYIGVAFIGVRYKW